MIRRRVPIVELAGRLTRSLLGSEPVLKTIVHEGSKWVIYSRDGKKRLGVFETEEAAKKRLRQIEFFKHQKSDTINYEPSKGELETLLEILIEDRDLEPALDVKSFLDSSLVARAGKGVQRLIDTFETWAGGKHHICTAKLRGKGFENPDALCAWLKDRHAGTTSWRGERGQ